MHIIRRDKTTTQCTRKGWQQESITKEGGLELKGGGYSGVSSADARLGWLVHMQFDQDATLSDPSRSTSESTPTRDYTLDSTFLRDPTASIDSTHLRAHIYEHTPTSWRSSGERASYNTIRFQAHSS
jgi:hypothetical protein